MKYPIKTTDRTGKEYTFVSGATSTATFKNITKKFENNPDAVITTDKFIEDGFITRKDLDLYVELGFLQRYFLQRYVVSPEIDGYVLTDNGKEALKWNRDFRKKWRKGD